jgi:hypothetical protein
VLRRSPSASPFWAQGHPRRQRELHGGGTISATRNALKSALGRTSGSLDPVGITLEKIQALATTEQKQNKDERPIRLFDAPAPARPRQATARSVACRAALTSNSAPQGALLAGDRHTDASCAGSGLRMPGVEQADRSDPRYYQMAYWLRIHQGTSALLKSLGVSGFQAILLSQ